MSFKSLLILLFFILSRPVVAQDEPPYIYYPYGHGYIIERADGSDSRFIDGAADQNIVYRDAIWSPSGTWLAWRAINPGGCSALGRRSEELIIASAETAHHVSYDDWVRFIWSHTRDQLFVLSSNEDVVQWRIIDPADPYTPLASGNMTADLAASTSVLQVIFDTNLIGADRNDKLDRAAISADGQWLAYVDDGPVMVDPASAESDSIRPSASSSGGNRSGYVKWHPARNWFISVEEAVTDCGSFYHTHVTDGHILYDVGYQDQVEWLPSQVDPHVFPVFEKPPQPQPIKSFHAPDTVSRLIWNADGSILYAYISDGDSPDPLVAWDVSTGEQLQDPEFPPVPEVPQSMDFGGLPVLADSASYAVAPNGAYDKQTGEEMVGFDSSLWSLGGIFQISSDERVLIASALVQPVTIWSLTTGERLFNGLMATAASISPDSTVVAVASGWDVHLYAAASLGF